MVQQLKSLIYIFPLHIFSFVYSFLAHLLVSWQIVEKMREKCDDVELELIWLNAFLLFDVMTLLSVTRLTGTKIWACFCFGSCRCWATVDMNETSIKSKSQTSSRCGRQSPNKMLKFIMSFLCLQWQATYKHSIKFKWLSSANGITLDIRSSSHSQQCQTLLQCNWMQAKPHFVAKYWFKSISFLFLLTSSPLDSTFFCCCDAANRKNLHIYFTFSH